MPGAITGSQDDHHNGQAVRPSAYARLTILARRDSTRYDNSA